VGVKLDSPAKLLSRFFFGRRLVVESADGAFPFLVAVSGPLSSDFGPELKQENLKLFGIIGMYN
jgi:hypothetical protein